MTSLPEAVRQVLEQAGSAEFFTLAAKNRVECTLNGHSIPVDHIGALERFVGCDSAVGELVFIVLQQVGAVGPHLLGELDYQACAHMQGYEV